MHSNQEKGQEMNEPVLVAGRWREAETPNGSFQAVDPALGIPVGNLFPVSSWADLEKALTAGAEAARLMLLRSGPEERASFLERFALRLEQAKRRIVETAGRETGLPIEPRLASSEFPRMTDQLRQAAAACRERSWCRATIDRARNIRSMLEPLGGPVLVFSPSNFPLAFNSVGGGDFAAALAAGNPVIAKANPGHPATTKLLAEAAFEALRETGLPPAAVQVVYHFSKDDGLRLVSHPSLGATAFTGGRRTGLALKEAADRAGKPIYLEMSSANPVVILPGALKERPEAVAAELFASCTLGEGQFCTRPGLSFLIDGDESRRFLEAAAQAFRTAIPGPLLSGNVLKGIEITVSSLVEAGAELVAGGGRLDGPGFRYAPALFRAGGAAFLAAPAVFEAESFGPLAVVVTVRDEGELLEALSRLGGHLTGTIYSSTKNDDDGLYARVEPLLRVKVGRLLNDRMPTGVAVSPAMNHGGPFPATGHPGFTSVGLPASMLRFAALRCYDGVRQDRLPPELRDANPTGLMWRLVDGEWTKD